MVGMENTFRLKQLAYWQQYDQKFWPGRRKLSLLYFSGFCVSCTGLCCKQEKTHITINLNHGSCHCSCLILVLGFILALIRSLVILTIAAGRT